MDATAGAFLDSKVAPTEDELAADETLAVEEAELSEEEDKILALDATDATELTIELTGLDATEAVELETTEASELELAVDATLDADDANTLDAAEVAAAEDGISEGDELLFFPPPPPPQAARLQKVMPYTIARALWRRRNFLDININDSEIILIIVGCAYRRRLSLLTRWK